MSNRERHERELRHLFAVEPLHRLPHLVGVFPQLALAFFHRGFQQFQDGNLISRVADIRRVVLDVFRKGLCASGLYRAGKLHQPETFAIRRDAEVVQQLNAFRRRPETKTCPRGFAKLRQSGRRALRANFQ